MADTNFAPGLEGIVAGETAVSTVRGGLSYRGYSIEDLAEHATFEEVAHLLLFDHLPTRSELDTFRERLAGARNVPSSIIDTLRQLPPAANSMSVMATGCSLLAHWDPDREDNSHAANLRKAERLLGQLPVVMAASHRLKHGLEPIAPRLELSHAANCLYLVFGREPNEGHVRAMDVSLILYAEHEFNASTFAARVIASTLADFHSAITGAIAALKGPLHGGANERVLTELQQVGSKQDAEKWVRDMLAQKKRLMGFGHRVYKQGDPRAIYLKAWSAKLAVETGNEEMEETAEIIERIVRQEKGLPANLDWPSARLYHYMGLPIELYTPLFVISRLAGWGAHIIEQHDHNRLIRPQSHYTGPVGRPWVPLANR